MFKLQQNHKKEFFNKEQAIDSTEQSLNIDFCTYKPQWVVSLTCISVQ